MTSLLIVATVGTDHHPFDRLVGWVDRWFAQHAPFGARCVIQYGTSFPPEHAEGTPYLQGQELAALLADAAVVISHGGPSTLMEVRGAGLLPLVVPRDPVLGEHVDGHQQAFAAHMHAYRRVQHVGDERALVEALCGIGDDFDRFRIESGHADADLGEFTRLLDGLFDATAPVAEPVRRRGLSSRLTRSAARR